MGWTGGTSIFNDVAEVVFLTAIPREDRKRILKVLIQALWNEDWDTESESTYWRNDLVQEVIHELDPEYPEWEDEDE